MIASPTVGAYRVGRASQERVKGDASHEGAWLNVDVALDVDSVEAGLFGQSNKVSVIEAHHRGHRPGLVAPGEDRLDLRGEIDGTRDVVAPKAINRLGEHQGS